MFRVVAAYGQSILLQHQQTSWPVHPKKVQQVKQWLTEAFSEKPAAVRYRKVLALTGPAGAGKSTTIRALSAATDLDYDVLEWQNDAPGFDPSAAYTPGSSFIERFTDFLQKAAKFPTLDLQSSHANDGASTSLLTLDSPASVQRNRVILLEDLPNLHHLPTKQLFQAALEQYIQQSALLTSRGFPNVPIVLIITESTRGKMRTAGSATRPPTHGENALHLSWIPEPLWGLRFARVQHMPRYASILWRLPSFSKASSEQ